MQCCEKLPELFPSSVMQDMPTAWLAVSGVSEGTHQCFRYEVQIRHQVVGCYVGRITAAREPLYSKPESGIVQIDHQRNG